MPLLPLDVLQEVSAGKIAGYNEAQTRYKIIDPIIFDILGWMRAEVNVEERVTEDGKHSFIDYYCQTAQVRFLVEAKRIGVDFGQLPSLRRLTLKGTWLKGSISEAVVQARDYGRQIGAGFCAVTNGDSWLIFPINRRDGVTFEDSSCI